MGSGLVGDGEVLEALFDFISPDPTALDHDPGNGSRCRDVSQGTAPEQHETGPFPDRDGPCLMGIAQEGEVLTGQSTAKTADRFGGVDAAFANAGRGMKKPGTVEGMRASVPVINLAPFAPRARVSGRCNRSKPSRIAAR